MQFGTASPSIAMALTTEPVAKATMLIRRPVAEVFNAFVHPAVSSRVWLSRTTGPLVAGEAVTWFWDDYGGSGDVFVQALEPTHRSEFEWPTPVDWLFTPKSE